MRFHPGHTARRRVIEMDEDIFPVADEAANSFAYMAVLEERGKRYSLRLRKKTTKFSHHGTPTS
ncbi:MAG TPA: hypothetical protein VML19_23345 [Verrucomicrobiae bacterium]|nr:hypothetical protein [Verrucomicrobiae bacterium]